MEGSLPMKNTDYLSIPQLAKILGLSRIAVYKKVKKGEIRALRIGRNYAIPNDVLSGILGKSLGAQAKAQINRAVKKTVREYGDVLRLLGNE
jgi:excisionase family DNA binding protein